MVRTDLTATNPNIFFSPQLERVETYVAELSLVEQLWLMEWLAQRIRESASRASQSKYDALVAMAGDQEIQREIHDINVEFAVAEADGLDKYQ
jgi:hypothetical protein